MNTILTGSNELLLDAREARDKLALKGGHEKLLAKLDDLLNKASGSGLHGGEALKLQNLLKQAKAL